MNNNLLSLLGLCKRGGMLEIGEEPVEAVARAKKAKVLLLAGDAAENTSRRCAHFSQAGNCPWLRLPFTKAELGQALGRTSCALLAVTDIGFAANIVRRLAAEDPVHFDETAALLDQKAKRAAARKAEMLAHEKKLRRGLVPKHPPKTPPPETASPAAPPQRAKAPAPPGGRRPASPERRTPPAGGRPLRSGPHAPGNSPHGPGRGPQAGNGPRTPGRGPHGPSSRPRRDGPADRWGGPARTPSGSSANRFRNSRPVKKGKGSPSGKPKGTS